MKFTPRGGKVEVSARRTASQVQISVTDTGEGIDPQFLPHIFEPFRQAESPQTRVHGGLGLGLSIVRYIAEAHGGNGVGGERRARQGIDVHRDAAGALGRPRAPVPCETRSAIRSCIATACAASKSSWSTTSRSRGRWSRPSFAPPARTSRRSIPPRRRSKAIDHHRPDHRPHRHRHAGDGRLRLHARAARTRLRPRRSKIVALSAFPATGDRGSGFDAYLTKPIDPFHLVDEIARIALPATA